MSLERYPYKDAVMEVRAAAEAAGIVPSAVEELCARVSREISEGLWRNVRGEPVRTVPGDKKSANPEEFVGALEKTHPHYWLSADAVDHAEAAFGEHRTLAAMATFVKLYGEVVYKNTAAQWGCSIADLKPGKKPGPTHDDNGKKIPPAAGSSTNPWSDHFNGDDAARQAKMASIIKSMGTKAAADLAKAAGKTISGAPLRR